MPHWVSVWGQAHTPIEGIGPSYRDRTALLTVRSALAGERLRLRLANWEGRGPLTVKAVTAGTLTGRLEPLTFGGERDITLAPGAAATCDELPLAVEPGELVCIRLAFAGPVSSGNGIRADVLCSKKGDFTAGGPFDTGGCLPAGLATPAVAAVELLAPDRAGALVCFGDSITQMGLWTDPLADALCRERPGQLAVLNKGIGGNRLLSGPISPTFRMYGRAGVERFERDALSDPGAAAVLLSIGTNDIGTSPDPAAPDFAGADRLEDALEELAAKVHAAGMAVWAATVLPRMGSEGYGPIQEAERVRLNARLLAGAGTVFDRVFDFDAALRDPDRPEHMIMSYDSGDHLHPSALGGKRLAECVLAGLSGF